MKRTKAKTVRKLYKDIGNTLGLNANLFMYDDSFKFTKRIQEVFNRETDKYAYTLNTGNESFIIINTKQIHKGYEKYKGDMIKVIGGLYTPRSMEIALAIIIIHEYTHVQIYQEENNIVNDHQAHEEFTKKLITKMDQYNMLIDIHTYKYSDEEIKDKHDDKFEEKFQENLFKCVDIIERLENKARGDRNRP